MKEKSEYTGHFLYLDNLRLRYPELYKEAYYKYLDNPQYRPFLIRKIEEKISPKVIEEVKVNKTDIFDLFTPKKIKVINNKFSQYDNVDSQIFSLMNIAEKEYPELWKNDQGSLYKLALQRFFPINRETISDWGEKETKSISEIITEATELQIKFNNIQAGKIISEMIEVNKPKKTGLLGKLFKPVTEQMSTEEMKEELNKLENKLDSMKIEIERINKEIVSRKRRTLIMATVLSVIIKGINIEDDFIYNAINDKNVFIMNSSARLVSIEQIMKDLYNSTYLLEMKVKEFRDLTLPSLQLNRIRNYAE